MKALTQTCFRSLRGTAWCGITVGFSLVLGYSLLFLVYAIGRSSVQITASLSVREGLVGTLIANAFALLMAVLGFALLFGVIAALGEALLLLIIYGLSALFNPQQLPGRAAWIGLIATGMPAVALLLFVQQTLGIYVAALWPAGFFFWLGLPCLLFIGATTWLSWQGASGQSLEHVYPQHA